MPVAMTPAPSSELLLPEYVFYLLLLAVDDGSDDKKLNGRQWDAYNSRCAHSHPEIGSGEFQVVTTQVKVKVIQSPTPPRS
ncbi:hypothetical protein CC1G_12765 [Coprinopsis cinerea okayama7|uniref:Uncharacterized protein n=1 Tax=Coprinopsis cinerea (strain Okayama-7 / 130 / ATCC MYA-4618 / FGSC 9003) TaxID=240176 RepID=A8N5U1_COPC7|nr:hypothetical protein CC1G_12765 [Coprinopsis cinerea okayama7\|eukprot:XP_001830236.1 hypothetical protein CC1G_12765 [Coprinopsis cinerea okayama7\